MCIRDSHQTGREVSEGNFELEKIDGL